MPKNHVFLLLHSHHEATSASCILSCSERDAATFSCSVLIMSITCVIDTASSSVDGATELERVALILPQQTQQFKELQTNDENSKNRLRQRAVEQETPKHHKHELWLGITFYTAPRWAPDDPAG